MKAKTHTKHDKKAFVWLAIVIILLVSIIVVAAVMLVTGNKNEPENDPNKIVMNNGAMELSPEDPLLTQIHKEKYYLAKNELVYRSYVENLNMDAEAIAGLEKKLSKTMSEIIVMMANTGASVQPYTHVEPADLAKDYLVLVNKYHGLDRYVPEDLVTLSSEYNAGSTPQLRKVAAEAFMAMADAARADGIMLKNMSGYRSYDVQDGLYNMYVARDGEWKADTYSAKPGYSEHQAGLATDINWVDTDFQYTPEYTWLKAHAAEYGFIERYPEGMEYITGFEYEPWHYRYVGLEVAKQVVDEGITYDEYYAYYIDK